MKTTEVKLKTKMNKTFRMTLAMIMSSIFLTIIGLIGFWRTVMSYSRVDVFLFTTYLIASIIFLVMGVIMAVHSRLVYKLPEGYDIFNVKEN